MTPPQLSRRISCCGLLALLLVCALGARSEGKPPQSPELRMKIARTQIQALKSSDDEVRTLAAGRLRSYADALPEAALTALRTAAVDRLAAVRLEAVVGLGSLLRSSVKVRPILERVAKADPSQAVRMEAAAALRQLRLDLVGVLKAAGVKHTGLLFRAARGAPTPRLRHVPKQAVPGLIRLLRHKKPALRVGAIRALQEVQRPPRRAVRALIRVLSDRDPLVQSAAAFALCNFEASLFPRGIRSRILRALKSPYWKTRHGVVFLLGKVHRSDPKVVAALTAATTDETDYVASAAACTLADLCRTRAKLCRGVEAGLVAALDKGQLETRRCAAYGLRTIKSKGSRLIPLLVRALSSRHGELRDEAIRTLSALGPGARSALPALTRLLKDKAVDQALVKGALKAIDAPAAPLKQIAP
jgi:HEAT repeats